MDTTLKHVKEELSQLKNTKKDIASLEKFFQVFPGGYGEGDQFIGVSVPNQRKVAMVHFKTISIASLEYLLQSPIHEHRLTALFMMVKRFEKAKDDKTKQEIANLYLTHLEFVNNWDLVDSSAPYILGPYLFYTEQSDILYNLAKTSHLWKQRVAMLSCFYYIRKGEYEHPISLATMLLHHKHDLMHKAVGWMLREIGNRDLAIELAFLEQHVTQMPRTMLRYAIEKFPEDLRKNFLQRK
ncbi:MAG TPA: DNA alkylation repair protein [Williamwhitmania sp.]|nr:DNA alkylation repair protein [Williamwhitmania sp.]